MAVQEDWDRMGWTVEVEEPDTDVGAHGGLSAFEEACREHDHHAPFEEHTLLTLQGARAVPHARLTVEEGGLLAGCAVLAEGLDGWSVEVAVLPALRGRGVGRALVRAAREHVAEHGGGPLRHWVHELSPAVRSLAERATVTRTLLIMRRDLDGELPDVGLIRTRPMAPHADADAWLALSNAAFAGHPENGGWSRADLDWRLGAMWTDPARWPVIEDAEGLVAGVWTKRVPAQDEGELYVVAVAPRAQGQGLGRVVVARALHDLRSAGCRGAFLYVDADNARAVALYRWAGFVEHEVHRCLEQNVPSALSTPIEGQDVLH